MCYEKPIHVPSIRRVITNVCASAPGINRANTSAEKKSHNGTIWVSNEKAWIFWDLRNPKHLLHCNSPADPQKSCIRCSKDKRSKAQFNGFPYLPFLTVFSGCNLTFWTMKYPTNSKRLNLLNSWFNAFNLWTSQWVSVLIIAFTCSYVCRRGSYTKYYLEQVCMHMNLVLLPF